MSTTDARDFLILFLFFFQNQNITKKSKISQLAICGDVYRHTQTTYTHTHSGIRMGAMIGCPQ